MSDVRPHVLSAALVVALCLLPALAAQAQSGDADREFREAAARCEAQPDRSTRYVVVDAARMRSLPRADGGAVTSVPIGAEVQVQCQLGDWVRATSERPNPSVGWIRADLLGPRAPTAASLEQDYRRAAGAERRTIAERAIALRPFARDSHQLLIDALQADGDGAAARAAIERRERMTAPKVERLAGEPRLLFGVDHGYLTAIARIDGRGRYAEAATGDATYPVWRGFHFYRNGAGDGLVQVIERGEEVGLGLEAKVRHPPATERDDKLAGLASNEPLGAGAARVEAKLSSDERRAVERELRALLTGKRLDRAAIDKALRPYDEEQRAGLRAHAVVLAGGQRLLVATADAAVPLKRPDQADSALDAVLVLEASGKQYRKVGDIARETGGDMVETHAFHDALDLDGDGEAELIFRLHQYEGSSYQIWTRQSGQWKPVYAGGYTGA
ncbi:SH3 domain-containing protein [Lysobacter firmicutimachus]|uniref:SH3 domain-containing protein n=1 Tax=Lysobacter firmicutimachus TaxID=1792846 RepID=A0AAU8MSS7_9GAMM